MREQLSMLGMRLRELRKERKLTLRQLAARTGLTAGLLSKIENFRTVPSLPVLFSVAGALRCDLGELFSSLAAAAAKKWIAVRAGEIRRIQRENSSGVFYDLAMTAGVSASEMQIMFCTVKPGAKRRPVTGSGYEVLYFLEGSVEYHLGRETVSLSTGDLLFFDSSIPHYPENPGGSDVRMLVVYLLKSE